MFERMCSFFYIHWICLLVLGVCVQAFEVHAQAPKEPSKTGQAASKNTPRPAIRASKSVVLGTQSTSKRVRPKSSKKAVVPRSKNAVAPLSVAPGKRKKNGSTPKTRPRSRKRSKQSNRIVLKGYVVERGTRDPLEGVSVYILGRSKRYNAVTDAKGMFTVKNIPLTTYRIVIPVPNFKQYKKKLQLKKPRTGKLFERTFYLVRVGAGLFENVTRVRRKKTEITKQSIQREEIRIIPGTQGDPLKVVQNLPGVARTPLNTGFFIVRGSAPEDSRVFIDGHQIPQLYHFGGLTAVVNGDMARSIDLLPGGFSAAYGRATGGIIQMQTRKAKNHWHGYLDVDFVDIGFLLEGPLWKGASLILSARRSHLDVMLNLVLPKNRAFDLTVAPRYYDYQLKFDWRINKQNHISLMFFGSDDMLSFLRSEPLGNPELRGDFALHSLFHRLQLSWKLKPSSSISHDLSIHFGFAINSANAGQAIRFDTSNWVVSVRDELRIKLHKNVNIRAGLDLRIQAIDLELKVPSSSGREGDAPGRSGGADPLRNITETKRNFAVVEPALYIELDWQVVKALRAIFGFRSDYSGITEDFTFNPRFSTVWNTPLKPLSFKATIGLFSQPPQLQEASQEFGNPDIQPEHAMHYTLGATYRFTPYFSASVTGYYKQMFDVIVRSDKIVERDGKKTPERLHNAGIGASYGMEVMIRHRPHGRFFGWISYTLGRSERRDSVIQPTRLFSFDQTHIFTLVGAYKLGLGFTLSTRFRLVSGNPTTPIRGSIFDADSGRYIPIPGETNSTRSPLFHQLDVRLDYKLTFTKWKLLFYLDVMNVYNYANQEGTVNNYDFSKQAPLTGIPIVPSFGIKGEF